MVLETELQHAEKTPFSVKIKIPESMQRFQDKLQLDQFFKFILYDILASAALKFRYHPQQRKIANLWVVICRGINRDVEELRLNDPDHIPASSELLEHVGLERSIAKKRELGSTKMDQSWVIEETHANQLKIQTIIRWKLFLLKKGSGTTLLPVKISENIPLKPKSQNWS